MDKPILDKDKLLYQS